MEKRPVGHEVELNDYLSFFAKKVLENDACALSVSQALQEKAAKLADWQMGGGEPSICLDKDTGEFVAGIQIGFFKDNGYGGTSESYRYTDFCRFNEETGAYTPSDELRQAAERIVAMEGGSVEDVARGAWRQWLEAMHELLGDMAGTELCIDRYTGEVGFGLNMPPGHALPVRLPAMPPTS